MNTTYALPNARRQPVTFVSGDTQTKADAARASAKRMIEKDGAIMITLKKS